MNSFIKMNGVYNVAFVETVLENFAGLVVDCQYISVFPGQSGNLFQHIRQEVLFVRRFDLVVPFFLFCEGQFRLLDVK